MENEKQRREREREKTIVKNKKTLAVALYMWLFLNAFCILKKSGRIQRYTNLIYLIFTCRIWRSVRLSYCIRSASYLARTVPYRIRNVSYKNVSYRTKRIRIVWKACEKLSFNGNFTSRYETDNKYSVEKYHKITGWYYFYKCFGEIQ